MQFIGENEITSIKAIAETAKNILVEKSGAGNDFLGWIDLPVNYDKEEFARIQKAADKIKNDSDVLVVIGIGGSYLGARAAIGFCVTAFIITSERGSENAGDLLLRKQHQQHLSPASDRCDRRP